MYRSLTLTLVFLSFVTLGADKDSATTRLHKPVSVKFLCYFGILTSRVLDESFQDEVRRQGLDTKDFQSSHGAGFSVGMDRPGDYEIISRIKDHEYVVIALDEPKVIDAYRRIASLLATPKGVQQLHDQMIATGHSTIAEDLNMGRYKAPHILTAREIMQAGKTPGLVKMVLAQQERAGNTYVESPTGRCWTFLAKVGEAVSTLLKSDSPRQILKADPFVR